MDPVGPWYASYNRLAGVQAGSGSSELHHHLATTTATGTPPTTTAQILPGSFLSPPPVGYESVFPLFHHAPGAKPAAHYVTQQRALVQAATTKQSGDGDFHPQAQAFFEQGAAGAWQQNSPFGILPHESVVATTTSKTYENFNPHFTANNHLNAQITKTGSNRSQSPQVSAATSTKTNASQSNSATFFQVPVSIPENNSNNNKSFSNSNSSNIQQSCIVSSPNAPMSKEYRVPQPPTRTFLNSPNPNPNSNRTSIEKTFASPPAKQQNPPAQIQTKAQTKVYSEVGNQQERQRSNDENQSQSSPISFSIMDAPGRLNYSGSNSSGKRPPQFQHNYRHYQQPQAQQQQQQQTQQQQQPPQQPQSGSNSDDFQRPKSGSDYTNSNGPDCNVVVPRRPSPLQAHSQASPLGKRRNYRNLIFCPNYISNF